MRTLLLLAVQFSSRTPGLIGPSRAGDCRRTAVTICNGSCLSSVAAGASGGAQIPLWGPYEPCFVSKAATVRANGRSVFRWSYSGLAKAGCCPVLVSFAPAKSLY